MRSEKPMRPPPRLSEVSPTLSLIQFQISLYYKEREEKNWRDKEEQDDVSFGRVHPTPAVGKESNCDNIAWIYRQLYRTLFDPSPSDALQTSFSE